MDVFAFLFILGLVSSNIVCTNGKRHVHVINVLHHGARGDGKTDDSQAFLKTWKAACNAGRAATRVIVPVKKTYLLNPVIFYGPCKTKKIDFVIYGKIIAPTSPSLWNGKDTSLWLAFESVTGLNVFGSGMIDGRGNGWWDQSCRYHPSLGCTKLAPTALKFLSCKDCSLGNIGLINSPQTHVLIQGCNGFKVDKVTIQSPGNTPNTDGIHIHSSHSLKITNSKIGSGDDCVSIGDYTSEIDIANVECGPGHGISIGSLGKGGNFVQVENIHVSHCSFKGTTNGARIKTWQVGRGYVRNISFENLKFDAVKNPLIIDQNYCSVHGACKELSTGVKISNVIYKRFSGTSATDIAINLNCSRSIPCAAITMEAINLTSAKAGKGVSATCVNVLGKETNVVPGPCLENQVYSHWKAKDYTRKNVT